MKSLIKRYKKGEPFSAIVTWRYEEDHDGADKFFCLFFRFCFRRLYWGPHFLFMWFGKTSWRSRAQLRIRILRAKLIGLEGHPFYVRDAAQALGLPHRTQWEALRSLRRYEKEAKHADT